MQLTNGIDEKAMLVRLNIRGWSAEKQDAEVGQAAAKAKNADASMVKGRKVLVKSAYLDAFWKVAQGARAYQHSVTLPWLDGGLRILPVKRWGEYSAKMREFHNEADEWKAKFITGYAEAREAAEEKLQSLFKQGDYPTAEAMQGKFGFHHQVLPISRAGDFRVEMGDKELKEIRNGIEADLKEVWQQGVQDIWQRLFERCEHIHERLADPDKSPRVTLVTKTAEILDVLDDLNINGDPKLAKMVAELRLKVIEPGIDRLKEDDKVRNAATKATKHILEQCKGVLA